MKQWRGRIENPTTGKEEAQKDEMRESGREGRREKRKKLLQMICRCERYVDMGNSIRF